MNKILFIGFLLGLTFAAKITATVKYDEGDDADYPCYSKTVIEFDGEDAAVFGMRYKEKDGDW